MNSDYLISSNLQWVPKLLGTVKKVKDTLSSSLKMDEKTMISNQEMFY